MTTITHNSRFIFTYGFALFAMFFGSGNLVFPLQIGQSSSMYWFLGFLGLILTGILLPFLGLFVIKLHRGNYHSFFKEAGPLAGIVLPLFTLSLLGSFGVVPRCITVAFGGVSEIFPGLPLFLFSLIFCALTFFLCLKDTFMVKIIGTWMSPILLLTLSVLIMIGIYEAPAIIPSALPHGCEAFSNGFLTGYQTMDLFAAFFFSALIFAQIQKAMDTDDHKAVIRFAIKPSMIGAGLLALIYLGFVFLGAHYTDLIQGVTPESMLPTIAHHAMGHYASIFLGIAILFSCLTTAVALNNIYARYLTSLFVGEKAGENKGSKEQKCFIFTLLATTSTSFTLSLLDFKGIAAFLAPALEMSYPGIIALTILSIALKGHEKLKMYSFYGITAAMILYWVLG
ncbi:MAG: branched-chain amino acid transport system II carrier protein [Alphaproteobacteria bacterium]|nr:branched-chain amino acid transport system II carrier protein [Alphaproteobacteria bacterium]